MAWQHDPPERDDLYPLAAKEIAFESLLDCITGQHRDPREVIGADIDEAYALRAALHKGIREGKPLLRCSLCNAPVYMICQQIHRRFHFRHHGIEGDHCPVKTKGDLTREQIDAIKYHGARESDRHRHLKGLIERSLLSDTDFSDVRVEQVWSSQEQNAWRKPDVSAVWRGEVKVAFEIQLSTTYVQVIEERRDFYLKEGCLLVWIFEDFDIASSRVAMEDIYYTNNRNAFVANEETFQATLDKGELVLDCVWSEPTIEQGELLWSPRREKVEFSGLTQDREHQRIYYFDAMGIKQQLLDDQRDGPLRRAFAKFWLSRYAPDRDLGQWPALVRRFGEIGIELGEYPDSDYVLKSMLDSLYSAAAGRPVGAWGYQNLVELGHHLFAKYPGTLWAYRLMLKAHRMHQVIVDSDPTGNWRSKKKEKYTKAWLERSPQFAPIRTYDRLICFLFPEIATELIKDPADVLQSEEDRKGKGATG